MNNAQPRTIRFGGFGLLLLLSAVIGACSSSDDTPASSAGTAADICRSQITALEACTGKSYSDQCVDDSVAACAPSIGFNDATLAVYESCGVDFVITDCACLMGSSSCIEAMQMKLQAAEGCIAQGTLALTPTAAQENVKEAFCAACPDGASASTPNACTDFFGDAATGTPGIGTTVLSVTDAVAAAIASACFESSSSSDCVVDFDSCVAMQLQASQTITQNPSSCQ